MEPKGLLFEEVFGLWIASLYPLAKVVSEQMGLILKMEGEVSSETLDMKNSDNAHLH